MLLGGSLNLREQPARVGSHMKYIHTCMQLGESLICTGLNMGDFIGDNFISDGIRLILDLARAKEPKASCLNYLHRLVGSGPWATSVY